MSVQEFWITLGIGIFFVILGGIVFILGNKEEGSWYNSISDRVDVREYLERDKAHPEPAALRIGGALCAAVGVITVLIAVAFRFWIN